MNKYTNAVYFTADWCSPCRNFKPLATVAIAGRGIDMTFANVDEEPMLAGVNDVMSLPTVIFYGWEGDNKMNANEVGRVAGASQKQLKETLDKLAKEGYNGQLA